MIVPNFAFLVPQAVATPSISTSVQSPGTQSPPGNVPSVAYTPIPLTCPVSAAPPEDLLSTDVWTKTLEIPYSTFNGIANGAFFTQQFVVYQNGTFDASDDKGNRFEIGSPTLHLPGAVTTSLMANSTTAVQTTHFGAGPRYSANITVTYSVYRVACQLAGIRIEASGGADWGPRGTGLVTFPFKTKPTSVTGFTAWFGTPASSGPGPGRRTNVENGAQALGFDWSDSKDLSPAYDQATHSLSWPVESRFSIDPSTVSSTSSSYPITDGYEGHVCYAQGRYWVFYYNGVSEAYRTSTDYGNSWSAEVTIAVTNAGPFAVSFACSGNTVAYVSGDGAVSTTSKNWYYRFGTLLSGGTISWNMTSQVSRTSTYTAPVNVQVVFDSSKNLWFSLNTFDPVILFGEPQDYGTPYVEVWKGTACGPSGCTITNKLNLINAWPGVLVPLNMDKLVLLYQLTGCGTYVKFWSGSSWTTGGATGTSCSSHYDLESSGYTSLNDVVEMGFNDPTAHTQGFISVPYSTSPVWGSPATIESNTGGDDQHYSGQLDHSGHVHRPLSHRHLLHFI